jgi:DNA-directed RNA polymerase specialized sigma24 family protein
MSPADLLAVDGLSRRERRVIEIAARERVTHADIADRLGISASQAGWVYIRVTPEMVRTGEALTWVMEFVG